MQKIVKRGYQTFKSIFIGMGITIRHLFQPSVTIQYPEVRDELPAGARSKLYVNIDDCIGCILCSRACPVNCIDIETVKATADVDLGKTSTGNPKRLWVTQFDIDMSKCMYCDLCVHPCPTNCIYMVQEYEYSEFDRDNLILKFSNLNPEQVAEVKDKLEKENEEKNRQKELAQQQKEQAAAAAKADTTGPAAPAPQAAKPDVSKTDAGAPVPEADKPGAKSPDTAGTGKTTGGDPDPGNAGKVSPEAGNPGNENPGSANAGPGEPGPEKTA
jgi:NADH-quinone oxidoreductase subunit I